MDKINLREEVEDRFKWDLSKIYKNEEDLDKDIDKTKKLVEEFLKYKGCIMDNSTNLLIATDLYFEISRVLEKLAIYTHLLFDEDMNKTKSQILQGRIEKLYTDISTKTSFYVPEILEDEYKKVEKYLKENKELEKYSFTFKEIFREKSHTLSKKEERLLSLVGEPLQTASNTYDMLSNTNLTFEKIHDEEGNLIDFNESRYGKYIKSPDRKVRKESFESLLTTYKTFTNTITETFKGSIKNDTFKAKIRNYKSALDMELSSDNIDIKLYDNLINKVNKNIKASYDYIDLKKEVLNLEEIHMYDLYAPMVKDIEKKYTFEEAIDLILKALSPLGKSYIDTLKTLIDSRCIDVYNNKGKAGGAYATASYDTDPYVLTNFEGTYNDVSTLAHELGHAMHFYYSNKNNSYCDSEYTIFLAEIASTVNEILLNKYCYNNASNKKEKLFFLNNLLEDLRATLIRQTMFAEFEKIVHEQDEKGEILSGEELSNIYYELNKKYYGNNLIHDDLIRYEWTRIPHFYNCFYVYKYATGISIASKIASDILSEKENAKENYLNFLKSGGKDYSLNILKNVGIDIVNDDTIDKALELFNETIKEFKKIYEE